MGNKVIEDWNVNDDVYGEVMEIKVCMEELSLGLLDVESEFLFEDYLLDKIYFLVFEEE